jgi:hypothetical protein
LAAIHLLIGSRRSTVTHHVHRATRLGQQVLINENWYYETWVTALYRQAHVALPRCAQQTAPPKPTSRSTQA